MQRPSEKHQGVQMHCLLNQSPVAKG